MLDTTEKFIPMTYDKMFKSVLMSVEARSYLIDILSDITKIPKEELKDNIIFKNTEHIVSSINERKKISDVIIEIENNIINLEMNKDYYEGLIDRNYDYILKLRQNVIKVGGKYSDLKKTIQINFDNYNKYNDDRVVIKFEMMDEQKKVKEGVNIESYHVILPNVKEKYYNKDCKEKIVEKLVIMVAETYEELEKLIQDNMELKPVGEKVIEISRDEDLNGIYDEEEHMRLVRNSLISTALKDGWYKGLEEGKKEGIEEGKKEGIEEGIKNEKKEIYKKMLAKNFPMDVIEEVTGLSKKDIDEI